MSTQLQVANRNLAEQLLFRRCLYSSPCPSMLVRGLRDRRRNGKILAIADMDFVRQQLFTYLKDIGASPDKLLIA